MNRIIDDLRIIEALDFDQSYQTLCLGKDGVTRFQPYEETGQMAYVPYIAVWIDNFLWQRVPANLCRIIYKKDLTK